jgi:hypothetical protein
VTGLREGLGAALALAAAIADWRGVKIAPQIRRQVPERWRWTMPLPLACGLYGVLLGLGFTTFVLAFAVWALAGISFATGDPALGVAIGIAFGAGRALPVLWMAPALRSGRGARRLDEIATEPALWLGLRRLDALGLGLCAISLAGASASASASAASLSVATDPSAAAGELAWQQIGGDGMLLTSSGAVRAIPGIHPALGQAMLAWAGPGEVTVANSASLAPVVTIPVSSVSALAVSNSWVVFRDPAAGDAENLIGVSLTGPPQKRFIYGSKLAGEIGRPALAGSSVVFSVSTPKRSAIVMVNLTSGKQRVLRSASAGAALLNPSLSDGRLLYELSTRCAQQLRIGPVTHGRERVLLSLSSTAQRDPGYQQGYTHAYNSASLCPNRGQGPGSATQLGSTALAAHAAYVTEIPSIPGDAQIIKLKR